MRFRFEFYLSLQESRQSKEPDSDQEYDQETKLYNKVQSGGRMMGFEFKIRMTNKYSSLTEFKMQGWILSEWGDKSNKMRSRIQAQRGGLRRAGLRGTGFLSKGPARSLLWKEAKYLYLILNRGRERALRCSRDTRQPLIAPD